MNDEGWMELAIEQAHDVQGLTAPNPPVGCVLVKDGRLLAAGAHPGAGRRHAELIALAAIDEAGIDPSGATAYVTLEPCSTKGRTGACTDALIERGIARVVYGSVDPNPEHQGRADAVLGAAGIETCRGVLADRCDALIAPFRKWVLEGRPWVIAKVGASLDGRLTRPEGESQWLTSEGSRQDAQNTLRSRCDAILIGAETARQDDPRLTFRGAAPVAKLQPWRVVLTRSGDLPEDLGLFTDEHRDRTLVFEHQSMDAVLADLAKRGVLTVLAEGGGQVHAALFAGGHVDEVCFYLAPLIAGGGPCAVGGIAFPEGWQSVALKNLDARSIGEDLRVSAQVRKLRRAVFFDRDGVINVPVREGGGYVLRREDFRLRKGAAEALRVARESGALAILVTNQKCVAKGLLTKSDLDEIHAAMAAELQAEAGVGFDAIYACVDDPELPGARYKPSPAMFVEAAADHDVDLAASVMIGDQDRDLVASEAAGVKGSIRVLEEGAVAGVAAEATVSTVEDLPEALSRWLAS